MFTPYICHVHSFYAPCPVTKCMYIYIYIHHLHPSFKHWPSNWALVIHIPHTHFTSWPSHWAYDTFAPYTFLLYGPVTGLALYIYHIARISTAQFIASHHTCTKYTQLLPRGPVTGLTSCIRHIDTICTTWVGYWAHIIQISHTAITPWRQVDKFHIRYMKTFAQS